MSLSILFLVLAVVMFALGAWSRWWTAPQPYYPAFLSAGLFFWALSQLWPMINKLSLELFACRNINTTTNTNLEETPSGSRSKSQAC